MFEFNIIGLDVGDIVASTFLVFFLLNTPKAVKWFAGLFSKKSAA